jgi:3-deoxy-manno-octulosonate cytidylyltransferase (CMP-KDO synthetase)
VHPVEVRGAHPRSEHTPIVAIIPARFSSTRFPGKPLADIDGRPMIEHVYRRAASTPSVGRVIVATDDARIVRAVEAFGGEARLTRTTHRSGTDRLAEVAEGLLCDIVVNVQGDEPLIDPEMIETAIRPFSADPSLRMSTLCRRIERLEDLDNPNVVKVVVDRDGYALYFSRAAIPFLRANGAPGSSDLARAVPEGAFKHIGLYVYRREFLLWFSQLAPTVLEEVEALEQLRALEYGIRIKTIETACDSIGVDAPEDLERVRQWATVNARR